MLALVSTLASPVPTHGAATDGAALGAIDWRLHSSTSQRRQMLGQQEATMTTDTYYSQPIELAAGHMIYTDADKTPLVMPNGTYAITSFFGDVVDDSHDPVPLSQVYDHHWIALSNHHHNQICGVEYVFGIGAESRNNVQKLPAGPG